MITETSYTQSDLHSGECEWCGNKTDQNIYTEDGEEVCADCYESEKC